MKRKKPKIQTIVVFFVLLSLLVALIGGIATYAAYTNSRHAQRTIAPYESGGDRFSSNSLAKRYSRENVRTAYVSSVLMHPKEIITVCNYRQGRQTQPYETAIAYTLFVQLVKYDAGTVEKYVPISAEYLTSNEWTGDGYAVTLQCGDRTVTLDSSHLSDNSFGRTFTGGIADSDVYALTFGTSFVTTDPNLYVEIVATPGDPYLPTLRGVYKTDLRAEGASNAWSGAFSDSTSITPSNYDGYNYRISGVGRGTCTITWNAAVVEPNALSLSELSSIEGATTTADSITFPVDSDVTSRYDLQFFKVNVTTQTWSDMNNSVVTFHFDP